jgi:hypothetical protein
MEAPTTEGHVADIPEVIPLLWRHIVELALEATQVPDQGEDESRDRQ